MNHDTVLRACARAKAISELVEHVKLSDRKYRQYLKFHDWLVRHDARQENEIAKLRGQVALWEEQARNSPEEE